MCTTDPEALAASGSDRRAWTAPCQGAERKGSGCASMWLGEAGSCAEPWASPAWPLPDPRWSRGAWKLASCQGSMRKRPGKGDGLEMQPHSRKQSPKGKWNCDITPANLSCFLKTLAQAQRRKSCSPPCHLPPHRCSRAALPSTAASPGCGVCGACTGMLWEGCPHLEEVSVAQHKAAAAPVVLDAWDRSRASP